MAENNQNSNENQNASQSQPDIKLTQEQFNQLLQASQNNQDSQSSQNQNNDNKENLLVKGYNGAKERLDVGTRGMDGSVFSIMRWIGSFVKDMIDGLREYFNMRQVQRRRKKEGDDE